MQQLTPNIENLVAWALQAEQTLLQLPEVQNIANNWESPPGPAPMDGSFLGRDNLQTELN